VKRAPSLTQGKLVVGVVAVDAAGLRTHVDTPREFGLLQEITHAKALAGCALGDSGNIFLLEFFIVPVTQSQR
jgi:hypothetical protein